jgi:uncharacterized caspase-like protein
MQRLLIILATGFLAVASVSPTARASEVRFALVIGNASYKPTALVTPANDVALMAQTLEGAGFQVTSERDLDSARLRKALGDFIDRIGKAGPDAVALVYFAGYGLQLEGENYLLPVNADMVHVEDVRLRAVRLSDAMRSLAALNFKAAFVILDAARANPSLLGGAPSASGLAWVAPEPNMLIAFNAAPGTVAPKVGDGYSPYARALSEMIRDAGQIPSASFDRVRLRVNEMTKGAQVPWSASTIKKPFVFFERDPGAPARADTPARISELRSKALRSLGATDAYFVSLLRDTLDGYSDFIAEYWQDPMARRVQALLAARRESITWARSYQANVPAAYWTYLERYPKGPHAADARRLLSRLGAAGTLPSKFARMEYDVPPPLPDELSYLERKVLAWDDPEFAFEPPPPLPAYFLGPAPAELAELQKPVLSAGAPVIRRPAYATLPPGVALPPDPLVSANAGLIVRGSIGAPVEQGTKVVGPSVTLSISPSDEAEDRKSAESQPVPASSLREPPNAPSSGRPAATEQAIGQVSTTIPAAADPPIYAPLIVPPRADRPGAGWSGSTQRTFDAIPVPRSRPAAPKRSAVAPPRTSGLAPAQSSIPQATGSLPPPSSPSARASSNNQTKPASAQPSRSADQELPAWAPKPATAPKRIGVDAGRPNAAPAKPASKPCTIVDGKPSCS